MSQGGACIKGVPCLVVVVRVDGVLCCGGGVTESRGWASQGVWHVKGVPCCVVVVQGALVGC